MYVNLLKTLFTYLICFKIKNSSLALISFYINLPMKLMDQLLKGVSSKFQIFKKKKTL